MKEHNRDLTVNTSLRTILPTEADCLSPCQQRRDRIQSGILDFLACHPGNTREDVSLIIAEHSKRSIGDALTALAVQGKVTREKRTVFPANWYIARPRSMAMKARIQMNRSLFRCRLLKQREEDRWPGYTGAIFDPRSHQFLEGKVGPKNDLANKARSEFYLEWEASNVTRC
ncbi:hypothetical protein [Klebsiella aerogenes]|uniref:hypothetical protein n=1 Tax=Klebsiella aerogenes TaxID=548 RepID=UPI001F16C978|nr:hypothetical protein [Klebsiella aerogenes]